MSKPTAPPTESFLWSSDLDDAIIDAIAKAAGVPGTAYGAIRKAVTAALEKAYARGMADLLKSINEQGGGGSSER